MKKALSALTLLAVVLGFCFWNAKTVEADALRWQRELQQADTLIQSGRWAEAQKTLEDGYQDWTIQQSHLRIVSTHSILDEAECLYCQVITLATIQDQESLLPELSALRRQLEFLALREQLSLDNIL